MPTQPKTPMKSEARPVQAPRSSDAEVDAFLAHVNTLAPLSADGRGRLIFAMDATMSRQTTWDLALGLQAEMFRAVKEVGGLDVQLVYFRGFGETRASKWVSDPEALAKFMTRVSCQGGYTQIRKVLTHARRERERNKVNAVVYVGDCMEEDIDELSQRAGALGLLGVPNVSVSGGARPKSRARFQRNRPADAGCLLPFRRWLGPATTGVIGGGRGVCDGRAKGSARLRRGDQ